MRKWDKPEHVGELAHRTIERASREAIRLWLAQSETLTGEDRMLALKTANEIRESCGLRWSDLLDQRRAA